MKSKDFEIFMEKTSKMVERALNSESSVNIMDSFFEESEKN